MEAVRHRWYRFDENREAAGKIAITVFGLTAIGLLGAFVYYSYPEFREAIYEAQRSMEYSLMHGLVPNIP